MFYTWPCRGDFIVKRTKKRQLNVKLFAFQPKPGLNAAFTLPTLLAGNSVHISLELYNILKTLQHTHAILKIPAAATNTTTITLPNRLHSKMSKYDNEAYNFQV